MILVKTAATSPSLAPLGLGLLVVIAGCAGAPARREHHEAVRWLQRLQRAGYERHDLAAYLSQWHPTATLTVGRRGSAGVHDRTLNRAQIQWTRSERMFLPPEGPKKLRFREVEVSGRGRTLVVKWLAQSTHSAGEELMAERYSLVYENKRWWVTQNRMWPVWTVDGKRPKRVYSEEVWRRLDAWAERASCFEGRCPSRLLTAWRFRAAWLEAKRISERPGAAHSWLLRGICAVLAGQVKDAQPSFDKALRLDPTLQTPPWRSAVRARQEVR